MVDFGFKCLWEQKQKKKGEGGETNGEGAMETDGRVQWREMMREEKEVGINGEKERREGAAERLRETDREQWRGWSRDGER